MKKLLFWTIYALAAAVLVTIACRTTQAPTPAPRKFGEIITPGHVVSSGRSGECPLGWYQKDTNTSTCSTAFGWTPAYSDAATTVFAIQNLAPSDFDFVTVFVHAQVPGAVDFTGEAWWRIKWGLKYPLDSGAFADPAGVEAGTAIDSQVGAQLSSCAPTLVQAGGQLGIQMLCGVAAAVEGNVDWDRSSLAPWVLSVSPSSVSADAGGTVIVTTTPGGAQFATAATFAGFSASCTPTSDHTASCVIPASAGFLSDGGFASGGVSLASAANPFALAIGFSFAGSGPAPTITSIVPGASNGNTSTVAMSSAAGGKTYTINGTNFVTGATYQPYAGAAFVATTFVSATQLTVTMPAFSSANGSASAQTAAVKNPGGATGTFANMWYLPSASMNGLYLPDSLTGSNGSAITGRAVYLDWGGSPAMPLGFNAADQGSTAAPTVVTGGPNGIPYVGFAAASSEYLTSFNGQAINLAQPVSVFLVASCTSYGGSYGLYGFGFSGGTAASNDYAFIATSGTSLNMYSGTAGSGAMSTPAAGPHFYEFVTTGGNGTAIIDSTTVMNAVAVGANNFGSAADYFVMGAFTNNGGVAAGFANCNVEDMVVYNANLLGGLDATVHAAFKARGGTP